MYGFELPEDCHEDTDIDVVGRIVFQAMRASFVAPNAATGKSRFSIKFLNEAGLHGAIARSLSSLHPTLYASNSLRNATGNIPTSHCVG